MNVQLYTQALNAKNTKATAYPISTRLFLYAKCLVYNELPPPPPQLSANQLVTTSLLARYYPLFINKWGAIVLYACKYIFKIYCLEFYCLILNLKNYGYGKENL